MSGILKVLSAIALCGVLSFAQDGSFEGFYGDEDSFSNSTYEDSSEEESAPVGTAAASDDEWAGFGYEEMGLTQWEFQAARDGGISREKLTQLVETGVRPSEYLQQPWTRLGVSEEEWLEQRTKGMEDSDIDRSYRNRSGDQNYAYLSLLVPSLYQWRTDQTIKAVWMDVLWAVGVGAGVYLYATDDSNTWMYMLIPVLAAHIWSFADAFFGTQWDNNPDANRFSFGIGPSLSRGVAGMFSVRF